MKVRREVRREVRHEVRREVRREVSATRSPISQISPISPISQISQISQMYQMYQISDIRRKQTTWFASRGITTARDVNNNARVESGGGDGQDGRDGREEDEPQPSHPSTYFPFFNLPPRHATCHATPRHPRSLVSRLFGRMTDPITLHPPPPPTTTLSTRRPSPVPRPCHTSPGTAARPPHVHHPHLTPRGLCLPV